MKKTITCPRCHDRFKSRQGLGNHLRFCQIKEPVKKVDLPAPGATRAPARSSSGKSISSPEDLIHESLTWGIVRRHGKWQPVPIVNGISYEAATAAAERRNRIPFTPRIHPVREEDDDGMEMLLTLLFALSTR